MTVPTTRIRHRAEHWHRLVTEQAASGLPARAFCAQRDLSYSSFLYWRRKLASEHRSLAQADGHPAAPGFIELLPTAAATGSAWELELDLGDGLTLRLRRTR